MDHVKFKKEWMKKTEYQLPRNRINDTVLHTSSEWFRLETHLVEIFDDTQSHAYRRQNRGLKADMQDMLKKL